MIVVEQTTKPLTDIEVQLTGVDGNAFAIIVKVELALKRGKRVDLIRPFLDEAVRGDYNHLLRTCKKYVVIA